MRTLEQALADHELIILRVIGEWWELDLAGADKAACVRALAQTIGQLDLPQEASYLPAEEATALYALVQAGGRMPVPAFSRQFGEVRLMGPARLEREEPWYEPAGPAEALWYRGFLYRAFDETADGLVEFFYLPTELLRQFDAGQGEPGTPGVAEARSGYAAGRLDGRGNPLSARPGPTTFAAAESNAVDDLTAMLAAAQTRPLSADDLDWLYPLLLERESDRCALLLTLAWEMEWLKRSDAKAKPTKSAVAWLQKGREAQLRDLADAWSRSAWNELCHTPGLICEGSGWSNDPLLARTALLDVLPRAAEWYRLSDLAAALKAENPDFQRPDGNYDTWYIRDAASGAYLSGFESWDQVEGQLLRFLVLGPLWWLGLVDVSGDELFRLTPRALAWLENRPPAGDEVLVPPVVRPNATILVPFNASRYHRFQVARVAEAEPVRPGQPFLYRLTPASLAGARDQGIAPERVLAFLETTSGRPIPPSTKRAIERWAERGVEGRVEQVVILRVREAETLDKLRANPKTQSFLGEAVGDLACQVRPGRWQELVEAAAQLGLLLDRRMGD